MLSLRTSSLRNPDLPATSHPTSNANDSLRPCSSQSYQKRGNEKGPTSLPETTLTEGAVGRILWPLQHTPQINEWFGLECLLQRMFVACLAGRGEHPHPSHIDAPPRSPWSASGQLLARAPSLNICDGWTLSLVAPLSLDGACPNYGIGLSTKVPRPAILRSVTLTRRS